jgi:hypothetical protein
MSSGDVFMYEGSDPGSADDWFLRGHFKLGAPISKRGVKKVGAELMMVTKAGYIPLSTVLATGKLNEQVASGKIRGAALDATSQFGSLAGWDLLHYPRRNQLIVNVPTTSTAVQHVKNTETGAWCRFTGMNATCWGLFEDRAYFGKADGTVHLYESGDYSDDGAPIQADGQTAFNYLGDRRSLKKATGIRTLLRMSGGQSSYAVGVSFDHKRAAIGGQNIIAAPNVALWDSAIWDEALWADESQTISKWNSAKGHGYAISARLAIATSQQRFEWLSNTHLVEPGGVL